MDAGIGTTEPPPGAQPPPARVSLLDRIGPRARQRGEPRFGVAFAGAGCALAVLGVIIIAGDAGESGDDPTDYNQLPGILICAGLVVAGYLIARAGERTPMATAGVVAAALGLPALLLFVTLDTDSLPPYNTELILGASAVVWLVSYVTGPGRGHVFFLTLGLIASWLFAVQLVEKPFTAPFDFIGAAFTFESEASSDFDTGGSGDSDGDGIPDEFDDDFTFEPDGDDFDSGGGFGAFDPPDPTTIGIVSIAFGAAYLLARKKLDDLGYHGAAFGFVLPGLVALAEGIGALGEDLELGGTGIGYLAVGTFVAMSGARAGRRGTTWFGAAMAALGVALVIGDIEPDDVTSVGLLMMLGGAVLVAIGALVASGLDEPPDDEPGASTFTPRPRGPRIAVTAPVGGPLPPPGAPPPATTDWGPPTAPTSPASPPTAPPTAPGDAALPPPPPSEPRTPRRAPLRARPPRRVAEPLNWQQWATGSAEARYHARALPVGGWVTAEPYRLRMRDDTTMRAVAALAASQHSAFTRKQAAEQGMTKGMVATRLRRGELIEPLPGVLFDPAAPLTFRARLSIATLAGGGSGASHRAAAVLYGVDGFDTAPIDVLVERGRYPAAPGVELHRAKRLPQSDLVVVDGIRTVTVARMLAELGAVVDQDKVEQALDWALRRGYAEQWIREVLTRVARPGPSGTQTLQRVLDDPRRAGRLPQTWFERLIKRALSSPDLPPLVLQYELTDPVTRKVERTLDGCFVEWGIGIEGHSKKAHEGEGRVWRDMERDSEIRAKYGIELVYVTWQTANRPDVILDRVRAIRRHRTAS